MTMERSKLEEERQFARESTDAPRHDTLVEANNDDMKNDSCDVTAEKDMVEGELSMCSSS